MPELVARYGSKAAFIMVVLLAIYVVRRVMAAPKADPHHSQVTCSSCGWQGSVSKYKPRCPKCAQPIST